MDLQMSLYAKVVAELADSTLREVCCVPEIT
jgi:hypothetical protein